MSDLWIFGRRPTALVRHRHGGFNATFPMNGHTVAEQIGLTLQRAAAAEEAAERARREPTPLDGFEAGNVVAFQPRGGRAGRGGASDGRPGRRPGPFSGPSLVE